MSFVGYGITSADGGGAGVRRRGQSHLAGFGSRYLWYGGPASGEPSATCSGDSGGPTFAAVGGEEVQVGVNAISDCASMGASARVDAQIDWIRQRALGAGE